MASEAKAPDAEVSADIDVDSFTAVLTLRAIRVHKSKCGHYMKALKGQLLDRPRMKTVVLHPTDADARLLLLSEKVTSEDGDGLSDAALEMFKADGLLPLAAHEVTLDYSYFTSDVILRKLLPEGIEVPGSFETIGHVAHLNLREQCLPYKKLIGKVLLDKNGPRIRTIVNKVGSIENTFRVPEFEVIAGEPNLVTEVKQHGATFKMDFGKVYWNSRLEKEHERLVSTYFSSSSTIVCDMMAGIGPFAIPASLGGCTVYANDLNPDSTKYLEINAKINKVSSKVKVFTMCGRAFVRHLLGCDVENLTTAGPQPPAIIDPPVHFNHVVMNLPATAIEFLDVFKGAFKREEWTDEQLPMIHCYLFARTAETNADIIKRGEGHLGGSLLQPICHQVRDVSPNKHMYCLSFKLSPEVAFAAKRARHDDESK